MQIAVKVLISVILGVLMVLLGIWFIQGGFDGIAGLILNTNITNSSPSNSIFPGF